MPKVMRREMRVERWHKHTQAVQPQPDKAGDGVPGYSSTIRVTFDDFSIYFMKKEKVLICHRFSVCKALCHQLNSTPDMELGIPGSCELGSFWASQENCSLPSTAEIAALHSF